MKIGYFAAAPGLSRRQHNRRPYRNHSHRHLWKRGGTPRWGCKYSGASTRLSCFSL